MESYDVGFPAQAYLGVNLSVDGPPEETLTPESSAAMAERLGTSIERLRQRLEAEPGVAGVTVVDALPRDYHTIRRVEVESLPADTSFGVATASIDPSYFDVLQAPVLAGRAFTSADLSPDARVVIVDQGFADLVMPGRNLIGDRVRISAGAKLD